MIPRRRNLWDVVIIGGGIAGLTAAVQAARRGLSTTLVEPSPVFGGQVGTVNVIHDWPATGAVSGVELANALADQARTLGVTIQAGDVTAINVSTEPMTVSAGSEPLRARRVIVASGAKLRRLGVPGEERLFGKGVSQCAHCDGGFFRNGSVVVVGGGDAALQEALVLASLCREVTIVSRSALHARRAYVDAAAALERVKFVWDTEVVEVLGESGVTGIRVRDRQSESIESIACDAVFPFVGSEPNSGFLPDAIARTEAGHVTVDPQGRTSVPGVFAIGAVRAGYGGDLVCAAGDAALAIAAIARELNTNL